MTGRRFVWDKSRFEKLKLGIQEAARFGQRRFRVDLSRQERGVEFGTEEALGIVEQLEAEFAKPTPEYPENREGDEP